MAETTGRRKFINSLAAASIAGTSGCYGSFGRDRYEYREVRYFSTSAPIVNGREVNAGSFSTSHYGSLVPTPENVAWEILEEEQERIAVNYRNLSFENSFMTVAGVLLDGPHDLHVADTRFDGGRMIQTVEIDPLPGTGDRRVMNAVEVYHDRGNEPPNELVVEWRTPPVSGP